MIQSSPQSTWVIFLSFTVAMLLAVYPLPAALHWSRPEWVALVLIYWVIALPQRVGIVAAFSLGLVVDVLEGASLGQNALALSVVAYMSLVLYQRLRVFDIWPQAAVVFLMIGTHQLLCQWVQNMTGNGASTSLFLLPALVSALLWPVVLEVLRHLRRRFQVT